MLRPFCSLLLLLLLSASIQPAQARTDLLTSIKPLQLIAAAIQQGIGQPDVLLPPGASAHHYSLRPSDIRTLQQAQLFYWIGPALETFLITPVKQRPGSSRALQDLSGLHLRYFTDSEAEATEEETNHQHTQESLDAHLWLDPVNARIIARQMADDLSHIDPANTPRYQANLEHFETRLNQLDEQLHYELQQLPLPTKPFFVFHEAFDYFENAYGLKHTGVFNLSGETQPGARHLARLRQQLQEAGPACVFAEPPLQPQLIRTLTEGLPVSLDELDPLGTSIPVSPEGYILLLKDIAHRLVSCLRKTD